MTVNLDDLITAGKISGQAVVANTRRPDERWRTIHGNRLVGPASELRLGAERTPPLAPVCQVHAPPGLHIEHADVTAKPGLILFQALIAVLGGCGVNGQMRFAARGSVERPLTGRPARGRLY